MNPLNRFWSSKLWWSIPRIGTYAVSKNNRQGISWWNNWIQSQFILLLGEQVLTIFLCIKQVRLNWNFIVYDVQNATYSSHGASCPARDLFTWLNTRVNVHISVWTMREYPKRHSSYLSDSGDTFLPLYTWPQNLATYVHFGSYIVCSISNRNEAAKK